MTTKGKIGSLNSFAAKLKEREQQVQSIASTIPEMELPNEKETEQTSEDDATNNIPKETLSEKKKTDILKIDYFFRKSTEKEKMEIVRIPSELHSKIKMLSLFSKTSITEIITNIVSQTLIANESEISAFIKKNLGKI